MRNLGWVAVIGVSNEDGLKHELFVVQNKPIIGDKRWLGIFPYKGVVGFEKTESEMRKEALKFALSVDKNAYATVRIIAYMNNLTGVRVIWQDGYWLEEDFINDYSDD